MGPYRQLFLVALALSTTVSCSTPTDDSDSELAVLAVLNQDLREASQSLPLSGERSVPEFPNLVPVPGGTFTMGSRHGDADERPLHTVSVSPLLAATTEVTQAQYQSLTGSNPSLFVDPDRPVENVSWLDAVAYCNLLSDAQGLGRVYRVSRDDTVEWLPDVVGYRLPTEAEWEWLARGGETAALGWTNETAGGITHQVGQLAPNRFGLHDLVGNVWEWCWDWYGTYPEGEVVNPLGPAAGTYRAGRGGTWAQGAYAARIANRVELGTPGYRNAVAGFRVVRNAAPKAGT